MLTTCVGEVGLLACFGICCMARAGDGRPPVASANRNGMELKLRDEDETIISLTHTNFHISLLLLCVSCSFLSVFFCSWGR